MTAIDPDRDEKARRMSAFGMFGGIVGADELDRLLAPLTADELAAWHDGPLFPSEQGSG